MDKQVKNRLPRKLKKMAKRKVLHKSDISTKHLRIIEFKVIDGLLEYHVRFSKNFHNRFHNVKGKKLLWTTFVPSCSR